MRARLQAALVAVSALAALGSAGCKDYTYFDVHVQFDPATFSGQVGRVQACHLFVTGAETNDYGIANNTRNCPPANAGLDMGIFEYSSLADSGQLTFTMKVYKGMVESETCLFGQGSVSATLPAPLTTNLLDLSVVQMGIGCQ
jgi:hypothetical protein